MKKIKNVFLISVLLIYGFEVFSQDFQINFSGSGASSHVITVLVENLTQGTSLNMNGNETLYLQSWPVGITEIFQNDKEKISIYPNPTKDNYTTIRFYQPQADETKIIVTDITGRELASSFHYLYAGLHFFRISNLGKGMFVIHNQFGENIYVAKIISSSSQRGFLNIQYINNQFKAKQNIETLKSTTVKVSMQYNKGDLLKLTGSSGKYETVVMVMPSDDKTIDFKFIKCEDGDGNNYPIIQVGEQWWMAENLKTTKSQDGKSIQNVTDNSLWKNATDGVYCWYDNNKTANKNMYGALYNWNLINSARICPKGWHFPSSSEWDKLYDYVNGNNFSVPAQNLCTVVPNIWSHSIQPTNITGFNAYPCGYRPVTGRFRSLGTHAFFWSKTERDNDHATSYSISYAHYFDSGYQPKVDGLSVRCVKD